MDANLDSDRIIAFLKAVGERLHAPAEIVLLGGSALSLIGSSRPTLDLDFDGEEKASDEFRILLEQVASAMHLEIEAVPLHRFVPLPPETATHHIEIAQFGQLQVYVFNPYGIALSKLDRGLSSDIADVAFLLREGFVDLDALNQLIDRAATRASEYDLDPAQMRTHLVLAQAVMLDD